MTLLYLPPRLLCSESPGRSRPTAALQELAASIRQVGILQPLTVRKHGEQYQVISGHRRLAAARMAGLGELPCILMEPEPADQVLIALTENLQREDLHYFEEAELLREYLDRSGYSQAQAARRLGRSQSAVANKLRLLKHTEPVRQALRETGLSERHARELLRVEGEQRRLSCLREIAGRGMTMVQTEKYISAYLQGAGLTPGERLRRRDTRLFLERVSRDAAALRRSGVTAEVNRSGTEDDLVLTVRLRKSKQDVAPEGDS